MSIQSEIERINSNVAAAYAAIEQKGGTLPEEQTSANLAAAVAGIPAGGQVYSTEETRIGTWLGKPLYRIVKELTLPDTGEDYIMYTYPDDWNVVQIGGAIIGNGWSIPVNSPRNLISAFEGSHAIICYGIPVSYYGMSVDIVIEYTKTTD